MQQNDSFSWENSSTLPFSTFSICKRASSRAPVMTAGTAGRGPIHRWERWKTNKSSCCVRHCCPVNLLRPEKVYWATTCAPPSVVDHFRFPCSAFLMHIRGSSHLKWNRNTKAESACPFTMDEAPPWNQADSFAKWDYHQSCSLSFLWQLIVQIMRYCNRQWWGDETHMH